ncbi:(3S)-malyl-CoA thioesterase [alpha proteobacterium Q-1]|nr:(3S)-malyl-CoA thioesterase [alpha proteobacterium Q-1]
MPAATRPRRSILYMPGSNSRALQKARSLPCDGLILDLEDAVSPTAKDEARQQVRAALNAGGYGERELVVRINALDSDWGHEDLEALPQSTLDAILLPKVSTPDQINDLEQRMNALGYAPDCAIWAMMETPLGILNAQSLAASTPRLACFVMGTNDLAKDLRLPPDADEAAFATSFGLSLLAARAYDLAIIDGVYGALDDGDGFRRACGKAAALGFDGKTLVHPRQIDPANEIFRPSADAIEKARAMVDAWAEAEAANKGVAVLDGKMIELLHVQAAKRLLALDDAITARG